MGKKKVSWRIDPLLFSPFPARTGCVDLTITNLLEGAVAFMPEDTAEGPQSLATAAAPKVRDSGNGQPQGGE